MCLNQMCRHKLIIVGDIPEMDVFLCDHDRLINHMSSNKLSLKAHLYTHLSFVYVPSPTEVSQMVATKRLKVKHKYVPCIEVLRWIYQLCMCLLISIIIRVTRKGVTHQASRWINYSYMCLLTALDITKGDHKSCDSWVITVSYTDQCIYHSSKSLHLLKTQPWQPKCDRQM